MKRNTSHQTRASSFLRCTMIRAISYYSNVQNQSNHTTMRICLLMHTRLSHFQIIASTSIIFHGSLTFYGIINFSTSCPLELIFLGRRDDLLSHVPAACKYAMLGFLVALFLRKNQACCQYCHGCLAHASSSYPRPSLLSRAPLMSKNKNEADTDVEG